MDLLFHSRFEVHKHAIKKNSRTIFTNKKTGRPFIGKSDTLRQSEQFLELMFLSEKNKWTKTLFPIEVPVCVRFDFYFANFFTKSGTINKKLGDLSNLYQLPEDSLVKAGILLDDSLIMTHGFSRKAPSNDGSDHLEVSIYEFNSQSFHPQR